MYRVEDIRKLIDAEIDGSGIFIVDLQVKPGNLIQVFADHQEGINIESCVAISRAIESNLDREQEDFELQVSSPGLTGSFKVIEQYEKNVGQKIKVVCEDGTKLNGVLKQVDNTAIVLDAEVKVKIEGQKKKKTEIQQTRLEYKHIKSAKLNLEF